MNRYSTLYPIYQLIKNIMESNNIEDLNEELESVLEKGQSILSDLNLEEKLDELRTETELLIRKNPIASVAIGAAVGFVLGRLLR